MQSPAATHTFSQQQSAILTSLSRGANRASACHAAGLPRRTFYNWIRDDVAFSEAVEEAEAESIGVAEDLAYACAMKAIEDPRYLRALFFWLKHRAGWIQARPDRPPSTPAVGAQRAAPASAAPSPQEAAPAENPVNGVPSVPSEAAPRDACLTATRRGTPLACPPPEPTPVPTHPEEKPPFRVPSVPSEPSATSAQQSADNFPASSNPKSAIQNPKSLVSSRQRDKLRFQQFRQRKRN